MMRVAAYEILVQPEVLEGERESVLKYVVHCMVADGSPYVRGALQEGFGRVLARRAIGTKNPGNVVEVGEGEGLVIEETMGVEDAREVEKARRQSIDAAVEALRREVGGHEVLKKALWGAVCYGEITLQDLVVILDFCRMLYEPKDELKLTLQYPRYYKVQNLGKVCHVLVLWYAICG